MAERVGEGFQLLCAQVAKNDPLFLRRLIRSIEANDGHYCPSCKRPPHPPQRNPNGFARARCRITSASDVARSTNSSRRTRLRRSRCEREEPGAAVLLLHHPGKDATRGGRGHSSVLGAVDSEFEISVVEAGGEKLRVVSIRKQKDLPHCEEFAFKLASVTLGTDRRGKAITSCIVEWCDTPAAPKSGRPRLITAEHVFAELETGAMAQTALIDKLAAKCGCGKSTVKDAIALARLGGVVEKMELKAPLRSRP